MNVPARGLPVPGTRAGVLVPKDLLFAFRRVKVCIRKGDIVISILVDIRQNKSVSAELIRIDVVDLARGKDRDGLRDGRGLRSRSRPLFSRFRHGSFHPKRCPGPRRRSRRRGNVDEMAPVNGGRNSPAVDPAPSSRTSGASGPQMSLTPGSLPSQKGRLDHPWAATTSRLPSPSKSPRAAFSGLTPFRHAAARASTPSTVGHGSLASPVTPGWKAMTYL